jgi:hypothetical protein
MGVNIWQRFRRKATAGVGMARPSSLGRSEAEALVSALNRSAERLQALWISCLIFGLYLVIAVSTTTHRMLFLEDPMPVLNIDLPLLAFFSLAPLLFVVFHFYVLLNLVLLACTAKTFDDAVEKAFGKAARRAKNSACALRILCLCNSWPAVDPNAKVGTPSS